MAADDVGLPVCKDLNDPVAPANGVFDIDTMISSAGFRLSAFHGYLNKSIALTRRSRLTICTGVVASKINVGKEGVVRGVHIIDHLSRTTPREHFVMARREVIVCAGWLNSPQLLMLR
jgi:choline dehydrogenase-like flavoprotein